MDAADAPARRAAMSAPQVQRLALQRDAAGEAGARQVEHVLDHAAHALAAREHAVRGLLAPPRPSTAAASRCAAVTMASSGLRRSWPSTAVNISFRRSVSVRSCSSLRELLLLPMQLEEHVRLVPQDVRLDRLVEEVDRAGFVALEHAVLVARAGGDEDDRHVARALAAAHQLGELEAVHVGHLHVEQRQRDVVRRAAARAPRRRSAPCSSSTSSRAQQRREREEVLLEVVDEQALHAQRHGHALAAASALRRARAAGPRSPSSGSTKSAGVRCQAPPPA